jgi:hypothetical protein
MTSHRICNFLCLFCVAAAATLYCCPPAHAAIEPRSILKTFFESGDVPTQDQFSNLIDSYIHQTDDGYDLVGIGSIPDGSASGRAIRIGGNVGINEQLPDTFSGTWKSPINTSLPRMCAEFCGTSGFLPLKYAGSDGAHYGFLQIDMGADPGASPGAPIFVTQWVWESSPNTALTTFAAPEPTALALLLVGLTPVLCQRRRGDALAKFGRVAQLARARNCQP